MYKNKGRNYNYFLNVMMKFDSLLWVYKNNN